MAFLSVKTFGTVHYVNFVQLLRPSREHETDDGTVSLDLEGKYHLSWTTLADSLTGSNPTVSKLYNQWFLIFSFEQIYKPSEAKATTLSRDEVLLDFDFSLWVEWFVSTAKLNCFEPYVNKDGRKMSHLMSLPLNYSWHFTQLSLFPVLALAIAL